MSHMPGFLFCWVLRALWSWERRAIWAPAGIINANSKAIQQFIQHTTVCCIATTLPTTKPHLAKIIKEIKEHQPSQYIMDSLWCSLISWKKELRTPCWLSDTMNPGTEIAKLTTSCPVLSVTIIHCCSWDMKMFNCIQVWPKSKKRDFSFGQKVRE